MTIRLSRLIRVLLGAAVLLAGSTATATASAHTVPSTIHVEMTLSDGFTLPRSVHAGWTTLRVSTPDQSGGFLHYLQGFRTRQGATPEQVVADFRQALTGDPASAAAAVVALGRDAELVGGAAIDAATTVSVTLPLTAGSYYFMDLNDFFVPGQQVTLERLRVTGAFSGRPPGSDATFAMRTKGGKPAYVAPASVRNGGTFLVANRSSEIHELALQRVNPGTTDADIDRFFGSGGPSPFAEPSLRGMGSLSPGRVAFLHIDRLPSGPYVFLDFVPDHKTGIPHALTGMHKVVRFR